MAVFAIKNVLRTWPHSGRSGCPPHSCAMLLDYAPAASLGCSVTLHKEAMQGERILQALSTGSGTALPYTERTHIAGTAALYKITSEYVPMEIVALATELICTGFHYPSCQTHHLHPDLHTLLTSHAPNFCCLFASPLQLYILGVY